MNRYKVVISVRAETQLAEIENYISREASSEIGRSFVGELLKRCYSLEELPFRGSPHEDIREGLRSIPHHRSSTIYYIVEGQVVTVIAILYGGRDVLNNIGDLN